MNLVVASPRRAKGVLWHGKVCQKHAQAPTFPPPPGGASLATQVLSSAYSCLCCHGCAGVSLILIAPLVPGASAPGFLPAPVAHPSPSCSRFYYSRLNVSEPYQVRQASGHGARRPAGPRPHSFWFEAPLKAFIPSPCNSGPQRAMQKRLTYFPKAAGQ